MEPRVPSLNTRRPALEVAGAYLIIALGLIIWSWFSASGTTPDFDLPTIATAPTSMLLGWVTVVLGMVNTPKLALIVLTISAFVQAAILYLIGRPLSSNPGPGRSA